MRPTPLIPRLLLISASLSLAAAACSNQRPPLFAPDPATRPAVPQEAYESQIRLLAAGTPEIKMDAARAALLKAGADAFPTLVAHLYDPTQADARLGGRMDDICFHLLQSQVDGNWPKGYREFYILTRANAAWWLAAHPGMPLDQLRHAAHAESLAQARAALAARPSSPYLKESVDFLEGLQGPQTEPER